MEFIITNRVLSKITEFSSPLNTIFVFPFLLVSTGGICSQGHSWVYLLEPIDSHIILLMRNGSNLNDLMMSLAGRTDSKLGFTTTVKEQV
jgi:hypothetical protein